VLSRVGRDLAMGRSPFQGVLPKYLKVLIISEVNSESEQRRGLLFGERSGEPLLNVLAAYHDSYVEIREPGLQER
jgi:hypothetical protein